MARAVILLSGGLDSSTTLALARERGDELFAFSVNYGQRHAVELQRAQAIAQAMNVTDHCIVPIDLRAIGGSALTDLIDVPKNQLGDGVPITYVPARNTILLGLALGYAETVGAFDIHIGVNILDYSGYPDCRPAFLEAFENLANLATKAGVEGTGRFTIHAPLLKLTKAEIIREATRLGIDIALTMSCYDPNLEGKACGSCDSCLLRKKGFAEANIADPTLYQKEDSPQS